MFLSSLPSFLHTPPRALALILAGVLCACAECAWPGRYLAGAAGAAMCLVGLAALLAFPLTLPGVLLVALAFLALTVHARRSYFCLPLLAATVLLTLGIHSLVAAPPVGWLPALALALPASLTVGVLLDLARRSRTAKRQPINTGLDAPLISPHNRETELCPRENRSGHDDQDQRR